MEKQLFRAVAALDATMTNTSENLTSIMETRVSGLDV